MHEIFAISLLGGLTAVIILMSVGDYFYKRGHTLASLLLQGTMFVVAGMTLVLTNAIATADTNTGTYDSIGWLAFAPDYVRVIPFVIAGIVYAFVLVMSITFARRKWRIKREERLAREDILTPAQRSPIDIELPTGDAWLKGD